MIRHEPSRHVTLVLLALAIVFCDRGASAQEGFVRGDADGDGSTNVIDALRILHSLFRVENDPLACPDAADVDDDGSVRLGDATYLLAFIFHAGSPPPDPFPFCGEDLSPDELSCEAFPRCEVPVFGLGLVGDVVIFVVDRSGSMQTAGQLVLAQREIVRFISEREGEFEFGVLFSDQWLRQYPTGDAPARASAENRRAGIEFVETMRGGSGGCPQAAFAGALTMAANARGSRKVIVYLGDGGATCHRIPEPTYLEDTLISVRSGNRAVGARVHAVGVLEVGRLQEDFLRALAAQNHGLYRRFDPRRGS